jgi:hypothetical protein
MRRAVESGQPASLMPLPANKMDTSGVTPLGSAFDAVTAGLRRLWDHCQIFACGILAIAVEPFSARAREFFARKEAELLLPVVPRDSAPSGRDVAEQINDPADVDPAPPEMVPTEVARVDAVKILPVGVPCESPQPWQKEAQTQLRDSLEIFFQWDCWTLLAVRSRTLPAEVSGAVRASITEAQRGRFLSTTRMEAILCFELNPEDCLFPQTPEDAAAWKNCASEIDAICRMVAERARGRLALEQELRTYDNFAQKWDAYHDISSKYGEECPDILHCPEAESARELFAQLKEQEDAAEQSGRTAVPDSHTTERCEALRQPIRNVNEANFPIIQEICRQNRELRALEHRHRLADFNCDILEGACARLKEMGMFQDQIPNINASPAVVLGPVPKTLQELQLQVNKGEEFLARSASELEPLYMALGQRVRELPPPEELLPLCQPEHDDQEVVAWQKWKRILTSQHRAVLPCLQSGAIPEKRADFVGQINDLVMYLDGMGYAQRCIAAGKALELW